jgi:hypothetical protein
VDADDTHESPSLTAREVEALADKCLARGLSTLFDAHHLQSDFLLISALLRVIACEHRDGVDNEVWREDAVMVARTHPVRGFALVFERDGQVIIRQIAGNGKRAAHIAVRCIAELGALQAGDVLFIEED